MQTAMETMMFCANLEVSATSDNVSARDAIVLEPSASQSEAQMRSDVLERVKNLEWQKRKDTVLRSQIGQ